MYLNLTNNTQLYFFKIYFLKNYNYKNYLKNNHNLSDVLGVYSVC